MKNQVNKTALKPALKLALAASLASLVCALPAAHAHVTLEQATAPAGSYQKLTFRIGHGCDGAATRGLTVTLPENVIGAKPMPKAGWKITTVDGKLSVPVESHGRAITSAVREVSWVGGPLPDAYYDEFVMQVKLPDEPGKLYFRVVQQCGKVNVAWDEMPGDTSVKLKAPAPMLEVLPAGAAQHQH
jgi:uncharacterized protein YcnI